MLWTCFRVVGQRWPLFGTVGGKAKFVSALEESELVPEEFIPILNDISQQMFEKWVTIEEDFRVCFECNFNDEAEIMQQIFSENVNGHDEVDYDEEENNKIKATSSSTEMKFIL